MSRTRQFVRPVALGSMLILLVAVPALGQEERLPAFPGAEGFGAYTPGGRGGRIIEVTNLNSEGPGSLAAACVAKGPRIVVFRVGGAIEGTVAIREPFITIAGQTAPGDGICIRNGSLYVQTHDVVIRYLRVRPSDDPLAYPIAECRDCLEIASPIYETRDANVIIDHCSFSWGSDENMSTWGRPRNVTIQWSICSEALYDTTHPKGVHSRGIILGNADTTTSIHHCLFAHNNGRNPLLANKAEAAAVFDIRNNVMYKHQGGFACEGYGRLDFNYVANTMKLGDPGGPEPWCGFAVDVNNRIYAKDAIWPRKPEAGGNDWLFVSDPPAGTVRLGEPIEAPPVTTQSAADAYEDVLRYAGCTRPVRDVVDDRIVAEVRAGTGGLISSQKDVGGWPTYASAAPPPDTDHDAMPDAWETRHGFDPGDPADGPEDRDGDGYTNVEEFLNQTDPARRDAGAPIVQGPVAVQSGNDQIRGEAAREIQRKRVADAQAPDATRESAEALGRQVEASGKEVGDYLGIKFARIPAGSFLFQDCTVTFTSPCEMSACEITQAQWEAVMGTRPWLGQPAAGDDPDCPATYVSYIDIQEFIARLNACGGREYRLPTFYEWQYAARGGAEPPYGFGEDIEQVLQYAWCKARYLDAHGRTVRVDPVSPQVVGRLKPNAWGLYNMASNVREWCHDWQDWDYHHRDPGPAKTDPMGPETGEFRIVVGGQFLWGRSFVVRFSWQAMHYPHYRGFETGFRLRRTRGAS